LKGLTYDKVRERDVLIHEDLDGGQQEVCAIRTWSGSDGQRHVIFHFNGGQYHLKVVPGLTFEVLRPIGTKGEPTPPTAWMPEQERDRRMAIAQERAAQAVAQLILYRLKRKQRRPRN